MVLIGVIGKIGSGKSEFALICEKVFNIKMANLESFNLEDVFIDLGFIEKIEEKKEIISKGEVNNIDYSKTGWEKSIILKPITSSSQISFYRFFYKYSKLDP